MYSTNSIQLFLGVREASDIYTKRMHNLCCDNCHSHVATALGMYTLGEFLDNAFSFSYLKNGFLIPSLFFSELMDYKKSNWNMVKLAGWMFVCGKYVNLWGFVKTWLPFVIMATVIMCVIFIPKYS